MFIAFALRTEPEFEFAQLSFCLSEPECKAVVEQLCQQFADDIPVEVDWVTFPDEPLPSPEQISDPSYIQVIQERVIEAFTDEPIEGEPEMNVESESVDPENIASGSNVLELAELQRLENAGLITQAESKQRFKEILASMVKREAAA